MARLVVLTPPSEFCETCTAKLGLFEVIIRMESPWQTVSGRHLEVGWSMGIGWCEDPAVLWGRFT